MEDKTNYGQSLMHMIKGNLGTGILAMPASFAHAGLINASIGMPLLCIICTYCVHLLVNSSRHLEGKIKGASFKYSSLAKCSFQNGPTWMRSSSELMCRLVDGILLVAQIGVCCVYLIFVTDNIVSILSTYRIYVTKNTIFMIIYPIALFLSYIRTLSRLAIASAAANLLQAVGISIILHYLAHDLDKIDLSKREKFQPIENVALGFGSAMFAFEGISVVLPVYSRMKQPLRMSGCSGIINVSYLVLLILNFVMGLFGFLRFGHNARDSITLNLPPEPLYDAVRAIFLVSVFLTYPLQFYVPNEIIWNWAKKSILMEPDIDLTVVRAIREVAVPSISVGASHKQQQQQQQQQQSISSTNGGQTSQLDRTYSALPAPPVSEIKEFQAANGRAAPPAKIIRNHSQRVQTEHKKWSTRSLVRYEYLCRTALVTLTFLLAVSVPKLNLLMDLIGSITGTTLSLILPAMIHTAAFWNDSRGFNRFTNVLINLLIIVFGLVAGACGTISSLISIMNSFAL